MHQIEQTPRGWEVSTASGEYISTFLTERQARKWSADNPDATEYVPPFRTEYVSPFKMVGHDGPCFDHKLNDDSECGKARGSG